MFCPKCGKSIGNGDRFCRYCGASTKSGNRNNGSSSNVVVNVNKNNPRHGGKKGNVIGAIQFAYKKGAFGTVGGSSARETAEKMIEYALNSNKTSRYDIEQSIYQIVNAYKSGAFGTVGGSSARDTAEKNIWTALRK